MENSQLKRSCVVRPARTFDEYYQALRLVHDEYCKAGLMTHKSAGIRLFLRELTTSSVVLVVLDQQQVVGTATVTINSPFALPSTAIFPDELQMLQSINRLIAEGTKFACRDCEATQERGIGRMSIASTQLLRWIFHACRVHQVDDWLITVHPRVQDFYQNALGFELVAAPQSCPHVANRPGVMIRLDIKGILSGRKRPTETARELFINNPIHDREVLNYFTPLADEIALLLLEDREILSKSGKLERDLLISGCQALTPIGDIIQVPTFLDAADRLPSSLVEVFSDLYKTASFQKALKDPMPFCFPLRNYFSQVFGVLESRLKLFNHNIDIEVADNVPDCLYADAKFVAQILIKLIEQTIKQAYNLRLDLKAVIRAHSYCDGECKLNFSLNSKLEVLSFCADELGELLQQIGGMLLIIDRASVQFEIPVVVPNNLAFSSPKIKSTNEAIITEEKFNSMEGPSGSLRLNVLVVEDNPVSMYLLSSILKSKGHFVTTATNGLEAVTAVQDFDFDLVLMDVQMPQMDGLQATREIRRLEKLRISPVSIYAVTSFVMRKDRSRCIEAGMDGYIPKPVNIADINRVLEQVHLRVKSAAKAPASSAGKHIVEIRAKEGLSI